MYIAAGTSTSAAKSRRDGSLIRVGIYGLQWALDVLILIGSFSFASLMRFGHLPVGESRNWIIVLASVFMVVAFYGRLYTLDSMQSLTTSVRRAAMAMMWALSIAVLGFFASKHVDSMSRLVLFTGTITAFTLLLLVRLPFFLLIHRIIGHRLLRKLFIVDGVAPREMEGYDIVLCADLGLKLDLHDPAVLHALSSMIREYDRVLVDCPVHERESWSLFLQGVGCIGSLLIPELQPVISDHAKLRLESASIRVSTGPLDLRSRALKRVFDLSVTCSVCLFLAPLLAVTAICIKLDSKGPVLFKQLRMGRGNRLFYVYKFRSMRDDLADATGSKSASRDDKRITRVGRIIRATSIDELPQLFNVLRGEMSLVGPRPHALGSKAGNDLFWKVDTRYWLRHSTKPGITGLAQIRGFRGATETHRDLTERLRYDLEYLRNWSIFRDISILLATFGVVIHKNAY